MTEPMFATPVDGHRLVVRRAPATPLPLHPMASPGSAQLFVAQPASWPPLDASELAPLREYFEWEDRDSYWWRTLRPAVVTLEEVTPSVWAATIAERGVVLAAGDDPDRVPDAAHVFRSFAPPGQSLRDPQGPRMVPDAGGETEVLRSEATRVYRATFPTVGPDVVWLRVFADGGERDAHLRALSSELEVVRRLSAREPELVLEVLHDGRLETTFHRGRYVAQRQPVGLSLREVLAAAGTRPFPSIASIVRGVALDVARTMALAHAEACCLGPLSPGLLRVRPGLVGGQGARATLVSVPGAGPAGGRLPPSVMELFPEGSAPALLAQFEQPYRRSIAQDLSGLGHLIDWMTPRDAHGDVELRRLADALRDAGMASAGDAVSALAAPGSPG